MVFGMIGQYGVAVLIAAAAYGLALAFTYFAGGRFERFHERRGIVLDEDIRKDVSRALRWGAAALAFMVATRGIEHGPRWERIADALLLTALTFISISLVYNLARLAMDISLKRRGLNLSEHNSRALLPIFKAVTWLVALAFLLDNFGFKISTLLAGLGVAGVAVGFAAQAVLGDLFSYFAILFDRPFRIGDFIVLDTLRGNIEHIGLKTTRIRSLDGEQIVLSNSDLTAARLHNYQRMYRRRILFGFGVIYQTPADKLEALPGMVRGVIEAVNLATLDRVHFKRFGDSSLDFEVVYFVESPDYNIYMDVQQAINLGLVRAFEAEGVDFAYPTRTLYTVSGEAGDA